MLLPPLKLAVPLATSQPTSAVPLPPHFATASLSPHYGYSHLIRAILLFDFLGWRKHN
jgi:hypothetical protein